MHLSLFLWSRPELVLDTIQFDPAIIAAGDEVDIVVQFHHDTSSLERQWVGNEDYTFAVMLESDDSLTKNYVTLQDAEGDDLRGSCPCRRPLQ